MNVESNSTPNNKNKTKNASSNPSGYLCSKSLYEIAISERNNYQAFQDSGCSGGGKSFDQ